MATVNNTAGMCAHARGFAVGTTILVIAGCSGVEQPREAEQRSQAPIPTPTPVIEAGETSTSEQVSAAPEPRGTVLILHAAHLADAAAQWKAYRESTGWTVLIESVLPAASDTDQIRIRADLQERIAAAHTAHDDTELPFTVLLLGDAPDEQGRGVPTFHFEQPDETLRSSRDQHYATDEPYQFLDDDDLPEFALGRVPARTDEEALLVLEKVRRYEQEAPLGRWRRKLTFVAGEGGYGLMDRVLESLFRTMIDRVAPPDAGLSLTYASPTSIYCPPPAALNDTVLDQLGSGGLLFNYVGHGHARGLDWLNWNAEMFEILDRNDLEGLAGSAGQLPIGVLTCCSTGWFDLPAGDFSLAEAMLFHESGPVAVIAGSRMTHPYANAIFQKDVTALVLADDVATIGELDLRAAHSMREIDEMDQEIDTLALPAALAGGWPSTLPELRRMHTGLYNLLGDPCTWIPRHAASFESLEFEDGQLRGALDGMVEGTAFITIESTPGEPARRDRIIRVRGGNDPELPKKAANNYPIANDHTLAELEAPVRDGRLDVDIDLSLHPRASVIRIYATGSDAAGNAVDASGAVRMTDR